VTRPYARSIRRLGPCVLLASLAGCVPPATAPVVAPPPVVSAPAPVAVDPSRMESEATIAQSIATTPGLTTLARELRVAELDPLLAGNGPYTLFAPTDMAFTRLAPGIAGDLLARRRTGRRWWRSCATISSPAP
jgi:hypothetical protein